MFSCNELARLEPRRLARIKECGYFWNSKVLRTRAAQTSLQKYEVQCSDIHTVGLLKFTETGPCAGSLKGCGIKKKTTFI